VSLITQALYCVVFIVRYLDLFSNLHGFLGFWNFSLKVFYISSSLYIVFLMTRVYARTREREKAWKMGIWSVAGSLVTAPVVAAIFVGRDAFKWRTLFDVSSAMDHVL
jgi:ER lumen protein retaining receptor